MSDLIHKFASLAHKKIKTLLKGSRKVAGFLGLMFHDLCRDLVPNADVNPAQPNYIACDVTGWQLVPLDGTHPEHANLINPTYWVAEYERKLAKYGITTWRKDAVLLVEQLAHFSPEVFRNGKLYGPVDVQQALRLLGDVVAFQRQTYPDGLLVVICHFDEYTPHAGAYVVPLVKHFVKSPGRSKKGTRKEDRPAVEKWTLDAKELFDPAQCSALQTCFADFLRKLGHDVVRGIAGGRTGFVVMQLLMKYLHSPAPTVPAFALPPELNGPLATRMKPQVVINYVVEYARSWAKKVEADVIEPLRAKALERDAEFLRCRGYQKTAWEKENELQNYRQDMDFLVKDLVAARSHNRDLNEELEAMLAGPRLYDVALLLLGRSRIKSELRPITTFKLPDGMPLEIDSDAQTYSRRLVCPPGHPTTDSVSGTGVVEMIMDVTDWNIVRSLAWIEEQWGPRTMAACLTQWTRSQSLPTGPNAEATAVTPEPAVLAPQLRKTSKAAWPATRNVLVDRYKFPPASVDRLHEEGRLAANRFGDLQFLSPQSPGINSVQIYPLMHKVFSGDGIVSPQKPFNLGSGTDFLAIVERPIDVMAFWESTPADLRSCLKVVAVAVDSEPIIWAELQKEHPAAALVDARSGTVLDAIRTKQQEVFPDLRVISSHPFETWAAAWRRQFDDKPSKDAFRTVQELLIATLTPGMPMGLR